jgi:hypothetical protein
MTIALPVYPGVLEESFHVRGDSGHDLRNALPVRVYPVRLIEFRT